jgi:hypothetical protein
MFFSPGWPSMNARIFFPLLALIAIRADAVAAHGALSSSAASRQSAAEVEDIGVIAEEGTERDPKSEPAPVQEENRFRLNVGITPQYTTNARLSGNHASSDFLVLPKLEAGYRLPFGKGVAFDTVARLEPGLYARHDERIFVSYSLQSTLEWRPRPGLPRIFVGAEPYRIDGFDGQGRITQAIAVSAGTDWGYGFNDGNSLLFVGYTFSDHFSDPSVDSRINHTATVGYTQMITPKLSGQIYYQYQHDNYQDFGRTDSRHLAGVSISYQIRRNLFTTLGGSFVDNDSTQNRASYQSANVSVGINYQY